MRLSPISLIITSLLLTACANQPALQTPKANAFSRSLSEDWNQESLPANAPTYSLEDLVAIEPIKPWLRQLQSRSFDLQISALNVLQQDLLADQADSLKLPSMNLTAGADKQRTPGQSTPEFGSRYQSSYQLGANVSWELDLLGRIGLQADAALLNTGLSSIQKTALERSIVTQAIKLFLARNALSDQVSDEQAILALLNSLVRKTEHDWRNGLTDIAEVESAKTTAHQMAVKSSQSQLERYELDIQLRQLASLNPTEAIPGWHSVVELPSVVVRADSLLQRPDVSSALIEVRKADITSQIAYKALFPSFAISLDASIASTGSENLFGSDPVWICFWPWVYRLVRRVTI